MMTLDEAIIQQKRNLDSLWIARTAVPARLAADLPPVNGRPVEVWRVPASQLPLINGSRANGTVMRRGDTYVIFISDNPKLSLLNMPSLSGEWLDRYLVLHELGHILNGDVFEDDPARIYQRYSLPFDWQPIEEGADAWACKLLVEEARAASEASVSEEVGRFAVAQELQVPGP